MNYLVEYTIRELGDGSFILSSDSYGRDYAENRSLSARNFRELLVKLIAMRFSEYDENDIHSWLPKFSEGKPV